MKVKDAKKKIEELNTVCDNLSKISKTFSTDKMSKENKEFIEKFYEKTGTSHVLDYLCNYCYKELKMQVYDLQERIDSAEI